MTALMQRSGAVATAAAAGGALPGFEHVRRFWDPVQAHITVKVLPGEFYVSRQEEVITTVLGSCVAACLWDRDQGIGGMNHFMLPGDGPGKSAPADATGGARIGIYAMELLINQLIKLGANRSRLVAKVFGGGSVLGGMKSLDVGGMNGEFVLDFLREEQIPVAATDLYGDCARKVHFFTGSGKVMVKKLRTLANDTIARREKEYVAKLDELAHAGDVDIFREPR